ncbi:MAG: flagellar basal body-associated FliL family protein [Mariprofundaceae bacterium]|nr:flagellar basal body-associated FliL family protein [Mariprofundaceae bacterium]
MADNEEGEKEKKSGGGLLPIINLVLLVLVLAVGGFVAWKSISMEQPAEQSESTVEQSDETEIPEAEDEGDPEAPPVMMDIDNITVNLADTEQSRFLRIKIKLEVRNEDAQAKVSANMVKIKDLVLTVLASKKFSEIRTPQGKYALKEDLIYRMNRAVGGKPIKAIYFTDFVSQ